MPPLPPPTKFPKLQTQPWQRLWLPVDAWEKQPGMDEDFMTDWGVSDASGSGSFHPLPGITELKALHDVPFLLLLGRPGAGKSQEMDEAAAQRWLGSPCVRISGKAIGSESPGPVIQDEIEAAVPVPADRQGLRILIDGLDEVRLQNPNFVPQLVRWMKQQREAAGHMRYRLAISCRWADWPQDQLKELAELWAADHSKTLVLCPLRMADAAQTLTSRYGEVRARHFRSLLAEHHLQPVACWPQGFKNLMTGFEEKNCLELPHSLGDALALQIQSHCKLTDDPEDSIRWQSSVKGMEWRQRVAGRLAAVMTWSGSQSLVLALGLPHSGKDSLSRDDVTHTDELWEGGRKSITLADMNELVQHTGLLKRVDKSARWTFHSQIYQEWLAADWLKSQSLDEAKLRSLFGSPGEHGWQVFPKLKPVAAWLARMDGAFRSLVLKEDPLVLLGLDAASLPPNDREDIVEAILAATDRARVLDSAIHQAHLHSLVHDRLTAQLRRWLEDESIHIAAKQMAVEMAEQTRLKSLASFLWGYYPTTSGGLQIFVANALYRIGNDEIYDVRWKAVLSEELPNDENATMLAAALDILVLQRRCVPVRDVLTWLLPKIDFGVLGLYDIVSGKLHECVTVEDLPGLFAHLGNAQHDFSHHSSHDVAQRFALTALRLGFQHIDQPKVASALLKYWYRCLSIHEPPHLEFALERTPKDGRQPQISNIGLESDIHRREVIKLLIHHSDFEARTQRKWVNARDYLVLESDFEWCLDQILAASSTDEWRYALFTCEHVSHIDVSGPLGGKLEQAWTKSEFLRQSLPVPKKGMSIVKTLIDHANKRKQKQVAFSHVRGDQKRAKDFEAFLDIETIACREIHEKGEIIWPRILTLLNGRHYRQSQYRLAFGPENEVREHEAWMREAAIRYLVKMAAHKEHDRDDGLMALFALAVIPRALQEPGAVREAVSAHWLLPLIRVMNESDLERDSDGLNRRSLASLFPDSFAIAFGKEIGRLYAGSGSLEMLEGYLSFWTSAMTRELAAVLTANAIRPEKFPTGLRHLSVVSASSSAEVAGYWITHFLTIDNEDAQAALIGAATILVQGRLFDQLQPYLGDPVFASKALRSVLYILGYRDVTIDVTGWKDTALLSLANMLWELFTELRMRRVGSRRILHGVSAQTVSIRFRDHISSACRDRGLMVAIPRTHPNDSPEEANERVRIADWNFHETRKMQAGAAWSVIAPSEFLKLAQMPNARLARSNDELMAAVVECLRRWENSLPNGKWDYLWDVSHDTSGDAPIARSRDETRIAQEMRDELNNHLQVVSECEVTLRTGKRTDILVKTITRDPLNPFLTVVVELKKVRDGNARERRTAMETQLRDYYMTQRLDEGWTHGLFVVAWTPPPGSSEDTLEAMQQASMELQEQAAELSRPPFTLKSLVIDARFRGPRPDKVSTRSPKSGKPRALKRAKQTKNQRTPPPAV